MCEVVFSKRDKADFSDAVDACMCGITAVQASMERFRSGCFFILQRKNAFFFKQKKTEFFGGQKHFASPFHVLGTATLPGATQVHWHVMYGTKELKSRVKWNVWLIASLFTSS